MPITPPLTCRSDFYHRHFHHDHTPPESDEAFKARLRRQREEQEAAAARRQREEEHKKAAQAEEREKGMLPQACSASLALKIGRAHV